MWATCIGQFTRGYIPSRYSTSLCLVVSKRPLRVEELAKLFAMQPRTFDANRGPSDPKEFIRLACSSLVAVVNVYGKN